MATQSYEELIASATKIKNNELPESNTHDVVGDHLVQMVTKAQEEYNQRVTGICEYNVTKQSPTGGIGGSNKYTLEMALQKVPTELRQTIGLKCSFLSDAGVVEEWVYQGGTFTSTNSWMQGGSGSGGNMILEWNTDVATTRKQIKSSDRKAGIQISYNDPDNGWTNEQYIGTSLTDEEWVKNVNWEKNPKSKDVQNIAREISGLSKSNEIKITLTEENTIKDKYWNGGTASAPTQGSYTGFVCLNELIKVKENSKICMRRLGSPVSSQAFYAYTETGGGDIFNFGQGDYDEDTDLEIFDVGTNVYGVPYVYIGIMYSNRRKEDYTGKEVILNYGDFAVNEALEKDIIEKSKNEIINNESDLEVNKYFFDEAFEKQEKIIVTTEENITSGKYWSGGTASVPIQGSYTGFDCITELFDVQAGQRIFFPYIKGFDKAIILFSEGRSQILSASTDAVYNEKYNAYEFTIPEGDMYGKPFIKAGINISNQVQENHIGLKFIINACSISLREQPQKEIKSWIDERAESYYTSLNNKIDTNKDVSFYYLKGASPKEILKSPCILVGGQSNAGGRVPYDEMPEEIKSAQPFSNVMICTGENGVFSNLNITGSWAFDLIVAYNISKIIQEDSLYLIKYAPGGVSIDENGDSTYHWTADYENIKEGDTSIMKIFEGMIRKCGSVNQNYDIKAMIWHQGEGDRLDGVKELYYYNFKNLIAYIRGIVGNSRMPFIYATQSHNSDQYTKEVEDAQLRIAQEDPYCCCIDMSEATLLDAYHFDAASTKYLGEKMFDALIDYGIIQAEKINPVEPWM